MDFHVRKISRCVSQLFGGLSLFWLIGYVSLNRALNLKVFHHLVSWICYLFGPEALKGVRRLAISTNNIFSPKMIILLSEFYFKKFVCERNWLRGIWQLLRKRDSPKPWPGMRTGKENDIQDRNGRSSRMRDCREKGSGNEWSGHPIPILSSR